MGGVCCRPHEATEPPLYQDIPGGDWVHNPGQRLGAASGRHSGRTSAASSGRCSGPNTEASSRQYSGQKSAKNSGKYSGGKSAPNSGRHSGHSDQHGSWGFGIGRSGSIKGMWSSKSSNDEHEPQQLKYYDTWKQYTQIQQLSLTELRNLPLVQFKLAQLASVTDDFDEPRRLLGIGTFGKVFKGWMPIKDITGGSDTSLLPVAIKRLSPDSLQGYSEWLQEIILLRDFHHENLINLIGYCSYNGEGILVYEFISQGSLDYHLHPVTANPLDQSSVSLDWSTRLRIAFESAQALTYLHKNNIIHRDFKSPNILLDDDFSVKVTDFGLAKAMGSEFETHVSTKIIGTQGYLDPCYMETGMLTKKSDVYAFGVLLLELLTGKKAMDESVIPPRSLAMWAAPYLQHRRPDLAVLVDPRLVGGAGYSDKAARMVAIIAKHCLDDDQTIRPSMAEVVNYLKPIVFPPAKVNS